MSLQGISTESDIITTYETRDEVPYIHQEQMNTRCVDKVIGKPGSSKWDDGKVCVRKWLPVKEFDRTDLAIRAFVKEVKILRQAQHFHVIKLLDDYHVRNVDLVIIMECADKNMKEMTESPIDDDDKLTFASWFACLATAMDHLHSIGVRHRDIKPENILIQNDQIRIADFGISAMGLKMTMSTTQQGRQSSKTERYAAPEVIDGGSRDSQADIFSLGAVFLEMLHAHSCWDQRSKLTKALEGQGAEGTFSSKLSAVHEHIETLANLLHNVDDCKLAIDVLPLCRDMLNENPSNRPGATKVAESLEGMSVLCNCMSAHPQSSDDQLLESLRKAKVEDVRKHLRGRNDPKVLPVGAMHKAASHRGSQIIETLLGGMGSEDKSILVNQTNICGQTPLHCAVGYGDIETVKYLVNAGTGIETSDDDGQTALHCAAAYGKKPCVELLIQRLKELRLDGLVEFLNKKDHSGRTALLYAAKRGHREVIEILIRSGAGLDSDNTKRGPLHFAAQYGCFKTVELLLGEMKKKGENIDAKDSDNRTPLYYATSGKRPGGDGILLMIDELITNGAKVTREVLSAALQSGQKDERFHVLWQHMENLNESTIFTKPMSLMPRRRLDSVVNLARLTNIPCDLITLLATMQSVKIDILPITWQAALQPIGEGATGVINETVINIQTSLAFKRVSGQQRERESESHILNAFINEITALGHSLIRRHPNIVRLLGICWDVRSDDDIWPVLVFEKSHLGDLSQFLQTPQGRSASTTDRMILCMDIGRALLDMHRNNIIHGDIKPENVLVFENEYADYTAKVTDFGYSTRFASEDESIAVPKSWPWNAPEHHNTNVTPDKARKMDVFSFGMLCLWIMFEKHLADSAPPAKAILWAKESSHNHNVVPSIRTILGNLKEKDQLLPLARDLLREDPTLGDDEKTLLEDFLSVSLVHNPEQRQDDMKQAFGRLVPGDPPFLNLESDIFPASIAGFDLTTMAYDLYQADYRVRRRITQCLENRFFAVNTDSSNEDVAHNLALQLAFCYETGFGVIRDQRKAHELLLKSSRGRDTLEEMMISVRQHQGQNDEADLETAYHTLTEIGHISHHSLVDQYRQGSKLKEAEAEITREIENMKSCGMENSRINMAHTNTLAQLYCVQERWKDAEHLYVKLVDNHVADKGLGATHPDTLRSMADLAFTFTKQRKWNHANSLQQKIMITAEKNLGENHLLSMNSMAAMAQTYRHQGLQEESERLELRVLETRTRVLGLQHPSTSSSLTSLFATYWNQRRSQDALDLVERTVRIHRDELARVKANKSAAHWAPPSL